MIVLWFYRLRKSLMALMPFLFIFLIVATFVFGTWGYYEYSVAGGYKGGVAFWEAVYSTIAAFVIASFPAAAFSWKITLAKYLAALVIGYGVFVAIYKYLNKKLLVAKIRYFYRNHTVILGVGEKGYQIARELLEAKRQVVVIEKDVENDFIEAIREMGGKVIIGNAFEESVLLAAGITHASKCVVLIGNDEHNLLATSVLSGINSQNSLKTKLHVITHVNDWYNNNTLKDYVDIYNKSDKFDIDAFSSHQAAAQVIYDKFPPHRDFEYKEIENNDGKMSVETSDNSIVIVGYNAVAEAFIAENIILSHYPGLKNLKIFLIDKNIEEKALELKFKYPFIDEYVDIIPVELSNENFYGEQFSDGDFFESLKNIKVVYLFGDNDAYLLNLANSFRQMLYSVLGDINKVSIVICLPEQSKALDLLAPFSEGKNKNQFFDLLTEKFNINPVRMISDTFTKAKLFDHEEAFEPVSKIVNYFYTMKYGFEWMVSDDERKLMNSDFMASLDDAFLTIKFSTQNPVRELENHILGKLSTLLNRPIENLASTMGVDAVWGTLTDRLKDSNRYVARHLAVKTHFLTKMGHKNFGREVIERYFKVLAPVEHKRWCSEKMVFKFRFGEFPSDGKLKKVLKNNLKIHNQLIPYEDLTEEEEDKDFNMFLLMPILQQIFDIKVK